MSSAPETPPLPRLRLWPAFALVGLALGIILFVRLQSDWPFQRRNLTTLSVAMATGLGLVIWWLFGSRAPWRMRLLGLVLLILAGMAGKAAFRVKGVTGDFVPIVEARWRSAPLPSASPPPAAVSSASPTADALDFHQFLGPHRDAILHGPALATDWHAHPPRLLWRQPIGAGWSGFALVGERAITQEQHGPEEWITAYDRESGRRLWVHTNVARYHTTIAGEGPRATPTVVSNRVHTLGATGILDCLDLETGRLLWTRSLSDEHEGVAAPEWGYAGSPWVGDGLVVVQAGGPDGKSLRAYRAASGEPVWADGGGGINYGSPFRVELAGRSQFLTYGRRSLIAQDATTGSVLWEHPFGTGMPLVANPILVSSNQILITAGYNVGAELLQVTNPTAPPRQCWASKRLKAKFANPVRREGFVYGLDDGMLACLDLTDGSQRWKEGRYGHGQGLWVGEIYLLMSESGDLVLLRPTPEAPNELARLQVFDSKTWNPVALRGDRLLIRNDREAVCLQLPLAGR